MLSKFAGRSAIRPTGSPLAATADIFSFKSDDLDWKTILSTDPSSLLIRCPLKRKKKVESFDLYQKINIPKTIELHVAENNQIKYLPILNQYSREYTWNFTFDRLTSKIRVKEGKKVRKLKELRILRIYVRNYETKLTCITYKN